MKLNMEVMYVPVANIHQKRAMMNDWKETSKKTYNFSFVMAVISFAVYFLFSGEMLENCWLHLVITLIFALGGFLSKKWNIAGYISVMVGSVVSFVVCSANYSAEPKKYFYSCLAMALFSLLPAVFAFRCFFNYKEVFNELKKCKGFPAFIANTADLYADKIYLKDKERPQYEKTVEASHNNFNNQRDVENEVFARSQELKAKGDKKVFTENFGGEDVYKRGYKKILKTYKYGKKLFGIEFRFLHNPVDESTFDEKKEIMFKWHNNIRFGTDNLIFQIFIMLMGAMVGGFGDVLATLLLYGNVVLFVMGTNYIKMSKSYGPIMVFLSLFIMLFSSVSNIVAAGLMLAAVILSWKTIFCSIIFLLNKSLYNELSRFEGFPHFIKTTGELYGDKLYIVEKREPVKKDKKKKEDFIVMDIGYDEKPAEPEKAWNAFDYRDNEITDKKSEADGGENENNG